MKTNLKFYWLLVLTTFMMVSFTSCEDDEEIGYDLSGVCGQTWYGNFGASYLDRYPLYSELMFVAGQSNSHGSGWEKTYYQDNLEPCYQDTFDWVVDNGILYIYYRNQSPLVIHDFYVSHRTFKGYFENGVEFYLYLDRRW